MAEEASIHATVDNFNGLVGIVLDQQWIGRTVRVVDEDDNNRPGENTIFGSPAAEFPDIVKEIIIHNDGGFIELPQNWIGRRVLAIII